MTDRSREAIEAADRVSAFCDEWATHPGFTSFGLKTTEPPRLLTAQDLRLLVERVRGEVPPTEQRALAALRDLVEECDPIPDDFPCVAPSQRTFERARALLSEQETT